MERSSSVGWHAITGAVISWMTRDRCPGWLVERSSCVGWLVKVLHSLIVCCVVSNGLRLEPVRFLSSQQEHPLNSAVAMRI